MELSRIAILGPNGRLGSHFVKLGCIPFHINLSDQDGFIEHLDRHNPEIIINCAGKTDVDGCERDPLGAYINNTFSIERILNIWRGRFVQLSTDYIFNGKQGPYEEHDTRYDPLNTYGYTKLFAETIVKTKCPEKSLIVRVTNLYDDGSSNKTNFVLWILNQLKDGKQTRVSDEIKGNPTYVPHLAKQILHAIEKDVYGILNLGCYEVITRYDLAVNICSFFDYDLALVQRGGFYHLAKRPLNGGLVLEKAKILGLSVPSLYSGLIDLKFSLEKSGEK